MDKVSAGPGKPIVRQALAHGSITTLLVYLLISVNSSTATGASMYMGAAWAFLTGLLLSHIIHEWGHFLGALIARASVTVKPGIHPLFFDYDFPANNSRQFIYLSFGGLLGNLLLLAIAVFCAAQQTLVMTSLLAAVVGQLVFVLVLELPVSLGVLKGREPMESLTDHFSQGGPLFLRAGIAGILSATLVFLLC